MEMRQDESCVTCSAGPRREEVPVMKDHLQLLFIHPCLTTLLTGNDETRGSVKLQNSFPVKAKN